MIKQFKHLTFKISLLGTIISMLVSTVVLAASGDLDLTFSGDGLAVNYIVPANPGRFDIGQGVAIQSNGRLVVAGYSYIPASSTFDFAVLRYNPNGNLDTSFSGDGRLITNFGAIDEAYDVALQADGKPIVVGKTCANGGTNCDVALARYNANGSLDNTFSGDGKQITDYGGLDNGSLGGVAIQADGKIVVAGYSWNGSNYDFAVYRYLSNGGLDKSFSGDGRVRIGFGAGRQDYASDLAIQSDGKIVVVGYTGSASFTNNNFAIARLNANGSLDNTFSGDGRQMTNMGADDYALSLALQSNGRIVVAGYKYTGALSYIALTRYMSNGSLDTTFNTSGKRVFSVVPNLDSQANSVVVQSDGKIVILGMTNNSSSYDFALVRLNGDGSFNNSFGGAKVKVDFGGDDYGIGLAIQSDGKYVISGFTNDGNQRDFATARVNP